jgi:hypothetical protein
MGGFTNPGNRPCHLTARDTINRATTCDAPRLGRRVKGAAHPEFLSTRGVFFLEGLEQTLPPAEGSNSVGCPPQSGPITLPRAATTPAAPRRGALEPLVEPPVASPEAFVVPPDPLELASPEARERASHSSFEHSGAELLLDGGQRA